MVELYFAYGSNLDPDQMKRRCPDSTLLVPTRLDGHELRFVGFSKTWQGGVATVHPADGKTVPGLIYRMTPSDFDRLDVHEGGYRRQIIRVPYDLTGDFVDAQTYIHLDPNARHAPSPVYASIIAHAYGRLGVDLAQIKAAL